MSQPILRENTPPAPTGLTSEEIAVRALDRLYTYERYKGRASDFKVVLAALSRPSVEGEAVAIGYISEQQIPLIGKGNYIPIRKQREGLFQTAIYTLPVGGLGTDIPDDKSSAAARQHAPDGDFTLRADVWQALDEYNDALRSAFHCAQRDATADVVGTSNYRLLADRLNTALQRHHATWLEAKIANGGNHA